MNAVKTILCSMIGTTLAIVIIGCVLYLKMQSIEKNIPTLNTVISKSTVIENPAKAKVYGTLEPEKIKLTIKNGANNQLTCINYKESKQVVFLVLNGNEERSYEGINEGESISCSFKINASSSTILNNFHATEGAFTFLFEKVPCEKCVGVDYSWATVLVNPKGERVYTKF